MATQAHTVASSLGTVAGSMPIITVDESGHGTHILVPAFMGVYPDMEETTDWKTVAFLDPRVSLRSRQSRQSVF